MPVFTALSDLDKIAALPDGTLISWLTIFDDPSSESCAFIRRGRYINQSEQVRETVWLAPGNGWAPEGLDALTMPVKVILLGDTITAGDYLPPLQSMHDEHSESLKLLPWSPSDVQTLTVGGTYPRDLALQAAAGITAQTTMTSTSAEKCIEVTLMLAEAFADWLIQLPGQPDAVLAEPFHDTAPGTRPGYFAGGLTDA